MKISAIWPWLLLLSATPLAAQDTRLDRRFPAPVVARLNLTIDSAAHEGLPVNPLVLRALEGQAKGASTDQILDALARLKSALRTALTVLGTGSPASEITVAAAALQVGMPTDQLRELHKLRGTMAIAAPVNAYLDLVARGAPPDRVWNHISDLARHRATDTDFTRLTPADVDRDPPGVHPSGGPAPRGPP